LCRRFTTTITSDAYNPSTDDNDFKWTLDSLLFRQINEISSSIDENFFYSNKHDTFDPLFPSLRLVLPIEPIILFFERMFASRNRSDFRSIPSFEFLLGREIESLRIRELENTVDDDL